jgi:hypothetical protein
MSLDSGAGRQKEHNMIRVLSCRRKSVMPRAGLLGLALCLGLALPVRVSSAGGDHPLPFHGNVSATWDNIFNGLYAPPANFIGDAEIGTHLVFKWLRPRFSLHAEKRTDIHFLS